mgnify:FL=1
MSETPLTVLAVHAHPDDETIFTGGTLAAYAARGVRVVVATLTDGRLGYDEAGVPGNEPGHDELQTVLNRAVELSSALGELGVVEHWSLGYGDSGMAGWPQNTEEGTLCASPVDEVVDQLVEIIEEVGPEVVLTYDANGFYGHPDHIRCHEVTVAAIERCSLDDIRFFEVAMPRGAVEAMVALAGDQADQLPDWVHDTPSFAVPDDEVTTTIDVSEVAGAKYRALTKHATQVDNAFFWELGEDLYGKLFGTEWYVARRNVPAGLCATDLLEGLS